MAEANAQGQQGEQFEIQKIYLKDCSFEVPNAPSIFLVQGEQPNPKYEVSYESQEVQAGMYEVVLNVTVTVTLGEQTAFLVEVKQAGVFTLANMPKDKLAYMVNGVCPNVLFPFAREIVSELITRGGFTPLYLPLMNFEGMYVQKLQQEGKLHVPQQAAPAQ
ncbi:protein-export chaperone SecB [Candidatus Albibeggiatoa sp. nov. NOAA]|uniref:protein-export chaperone SecB n=1 Tax=Candidatus Albibeggiatoa sp. nov. NOAA TaxID=3162724 RepID=UPI0032FCAB9A|nr:protein-export chaperone SecB [Thiotrichaceae bacterium]